MKENYKVIGKIEIMDGQGEVQGVYTQGFVYAFEKEKGDMYVEQGLAELTDHPVGAKPSAGASAPDNNPIDDSSKVKLTDDSAPIEMGKTDVPAQDQEGATPVEIKHATYRITGDNIELFGNIVINGEEYNIAEEVGDALVADGKAEKLEA